MVSPMSNLRKRRVNRTLHGRSVYRPRSVRGHNVYKGYSTPGVGDAVDLFGSAGERVVAPFSGVVYSHGFDMQTREYIYLYRPANARKGEKEAWAVLAHIDTSRARNEMEPPHMVAIQEKILMPVGTAIAPVRTTTQSEPKSADLMPAFSGNLEGNELRKSQLSLWLPSRNTLYSNTASSTMPTNVATKHRLVNSRSLTPRAVTLLRYRSMLTNTPAGSA